MQNGYAEEFILKSRSRVEFRDASLPGHELGSRELELRELAVEGD
jgi:hypothetical protein